MIVPRSRWFTSLALSLLPAVFPAPGCFNSGGGSDVSTDEGLDSPLKASFDASEVNPGQGIYLVGAGIYDVTGPAAEVGMMGFADTAQKTEGIFTRLRARAYIIGDGTRRVVFVSGDLGMIFQSVKQGVTAKLQANSATAPYYNDKNILLSAIHTHSGPGGFSHYFLYNVTTMGFIEQNYNAIVDGIYRAILKAHQNLAPGRIYLSSGELDNASMNRSPVAYDNNPAAERAGYAANVDRTMTLLKLVDLQGAEIGMINWFAVHPTSVGPANKLIGSDNKGLASYLFEKMKGTDYLAQKPFVASFAQANAGDVTPNLWGPADGVTDYAHCWTIAQRQLAKALELYNGAGTMLTGAVDYRHRYVDFSGLYVDETGCVTCDAAMGASFAAGSTEDNISPVDGMFDEGVTVDSAQWNENARDAFLTGFLPGIFSVAWPSTLDDDYKACHAEKPILIPTGRASFDGNPWTPPILPVQVLRIGSLAIVAQPTEITTMAGRRLRSTVLTNLAGSGVTHVVIAGLSNAYASYVTTREEYAKQHYEGAGVHFGPYTLMAYQQEFAKLAQAMRDGAAVDSGPAPDDLSGDQVSFQTGVVFDDKPLFKNFGDVQTQAAASYARGARARVVFWGGHPKNNLQIQGTYLTVEKQSGSSWITIARDWDPETTYHWARDGVANSKIEITWDTTGAATGTYRIRHFGHYKNGWNGNIYAYTGTSRTFTVQ
jgi:neutral ceramidase